MGEAMTTGNEVIDRMDKRMEETRHVTLYTNGVDWKELRRLALLGHAAETAPVGELVETNSSIDTCVTYLESQPQKD